MVSTPGPRLVGWMQNGGHLREVLANAGLTVFAWVLIALDHDLLALVHHFHRGHARHDVHLDFRRRGGRPAWSRSLLRTVSWSCASSSPPFGLSNARDPTSNHADSCNVPVHRSQAPGAPKLRPRRTSRPVFSATRLRVPRGGRLSRTARPIAGAKGRPSIRTAGVTAVPRTPPTRVPAHSQSGSSSSSSSSSATIPVSC